MMPKKYVVRLSGEEWERGRVQDSAREHPVESRCVRSGVDGRGRGCGIWLSSEYGGQCSSTSCGRRT